MNTEFFNALDALEKERGIPKQYMLERVEAALISAYKKDNGGNDNVRIVLDADKKDVKVYQQKTIVEVVENPELEITVDDARKINRRYVLGGVAEIEVKTKNFGRISAQTAKQVIIQGIREAERSMMIKEYESKREEVVTATVVKVDPVDGNVRVHTGTSEATLLKSEQIPGEEFVAGQHVKVFIMEVKNEVKGPLVTLSRTHFGLVKRLFEIEIPEIQDGTVVIKGISREAGSRTKIAVESRDPNVDPVGACIGNHGSRIAGILNELGNEKIDVIKYSEIPEEYVQAALSPATVKSVTFDGERSCRVIVDPDQLSLAIGKEGQNARLAARLTGFKIDIKTV
ncbi:MAG: transcription termination/antitermination protein NusA [Clostridia bacterium]|nr:transcription termination/antitermination protein NusA [Clostridia bacterium]MBP3554027.1 transcription termination/antitermination protein NusA [Clostridia bacterium]MBQ8420110.1 transcription termination/antitermination protein NusA [Clostridia bacterium]